MFLKKTMNVTSLRARDKSENKYWMPVIVGPSCSTILACKSLHGVRLLENTVYEHSSLCHPQMPGLSSDKKASSRNVAVFSWPEERPEAK